MYIYIHIIGMYIYIYMYVLYLCYITRISVFLHVISIREKRTAPLQPASVWESQLWPAIWSV